MNIWEELFNEDERYLIDRYEDITDAIVAYDETRSKYLISTPECLEEYETKAELVNDINYTLEAIERRLNDEDESIDSRA